VSESAVLKERVDCSVGRTCATSILKEQVKVAY
jgi:hypothetical protein